MTREATLAAELADFEEDYVSEEYPYVVGAARAFLSLLPKRCEHLTNPFGDFINELGGCDRCGNTGRLYPKELVERWARSFHENYERLAPSFGYATRADSAVPWPPPNADLMRATVEAVLDALGETE